MSATAAVALPRTAKITTAGLGPIKIGMTERQVEQAAERTLTRQGDVGTGGCTTARIGDKLFGLFTGPRLTRIYVGSRRYSTRSGIRIGDSEERVMTTYSGRVVREPHEYNPAGSYLKIIDGNRKVVFATDDRRVTEISTGRAPEIDYVEGCA